MHKNLRKYSPIFVLPIVIAYSIAFFVPFVMGLVLSFCRFTVISDASFVGLDNYIQVFFDSDSNFVYSLVFTAMFTIVLVVTVNIFAFSLALMLTCGLKGTNFFRSAFFLPNLVGGIVLGYVWQTSIDAILNLFEVSLLTSPAYGFWGFVIVTNWQMIGYMMVIYIVGIQTIPSELKEAAYIDGANSRQILFRVTIPMVTPSITICTFLTLINSFKLFDQNLALTDGDPAFKTEMLALNIYRTFYSGNNWFGVGQAKGVMFFLIIGAIALIQLYVTRNIEVRN